MKTVKDVFSFSLLQLLFSLNIQDKQEGWEGVVESERKRAWYDLNHYFLDLAATQCDIGNCNTGVSELKSKNRLEATAGVALTFNRA